MGHTIQGFIAKTKILQEGAHWVTDAHVIPLSQSLSLLPVTEGLHDGLMSEPPRVRKPYKEFWRLSFEMEAFALRKSRLGAVAYVETDYFGGVGQQAAILWKDGSAIVGPLGTEIVKIDTAIRRVGAELPVNTVLWRMGVEIGAARDEFEAIGLHHHRDNEAWIDQAKSGSAI